VGTGVFTGAYTIDEQDEFNYSGRGVAGLWLMTIPPLLAWVTVGYLICTHERVRRGRWCF